MDDDLQDEDSPHHSWRPDFGDGFNTLDTILLNIRTILGFTSLVLAGEVIDDMVIRLGLLFEVTMDLRRASWSGHRHLYKPSRPQDIEQPRSS